MDVSVFFFGLFLGFFIFTLEGVFRQTVQVYRRTHRLTHVYIYMIWAESLVNLVFATLTRMGLDGVVPQNLGYLVGTVLLWAIQTQLLSQIIANRVALIMVSKRKSLLLRWGLFAGIAVVNIAVGCIWTPAHLESASHTQIVLNNIFEHVEKSFFLIVDLGLNLYFLYLVRYRLIADGLSKYWTLYRFNVGFVVVSTTMDALLLGLLSLPNTFAYVQFAPVTYTVKLYLELKMAQLISKVVKRSMHRVDDSSSGHQHSSNRATNTHTGTGTLSYGFRSKIMPTTRDGYLPESHKMNTNVTAYGPGCDEENQTQAEGIIKTITTVVQTESRLYDSDESRGSSSSEERK